MRSSSRLAGVSPRKARVMWTVSARMRRPPQCWCSHFPVRLSASRVASSGHSAKKSRSVAGSGGSFPAGSVTGDEAHRLGRDALAAPGEAELLRGGRLDVDTVEGNAEVV